MTLSYLFLLFAVYSVIGWVSEVAYCSLLEHRFVNRGFLHGPLCPVYGFGGLLVIFMLKPFSGNPFILFSMAVFVTSSVEYLTGWALETVFSAKWWDYSAHRFNIHGRVCLLNSFLFGVMSVSGVYFVHPVVTAAVSRIPSGAQDVLAALLFSAVFADLLLTLKTIINLDEKLAALREFTEGLRDNFDVREWFNELDLAESLERLKAQALRDNSESLSRLAERFELRLAHTRGMLRIFRAFPAMQSKTHGIHLDLFRRSREKAGLTEAFKALAPAEPAVLETGFASGFSFHKLFWVYFIASFAGVMLEMVWCVLTRGQIESRTALIYGMLNPVYGIGALLMTVTLSRRDKGHDVYIFLGGMIIGGAFEYLASLAQELAFGTVSWEYSHTQLNLHGRTNLMFSLMWGVLGLVWVREVYPPLSKMIERIPVLTGRILTFVLLSAVLANIGVSSLAVHRWGERNRGTEAENPVDTFLDEHYPDAMLRAIYPNMLFVR